MQGSQVSVSRVIAARPEVIYAIFADYVQGHPSILPKPYFKSLVVERGGYGAGTVIRVEMVVWGSQQSMRLLVSEPQPGRVLQEEDPELGLVTTFTHTPLGDGSRTEVTIATTWRWKPGLAGLIERWITPLAARRIYREELALVAAKAEQAARSEG
jgi:hypothetical protein